MKGFTLPTKIFIKKRDNYTCQMPDCNRTSHLEVHHIVKRSVCRENGMSWTETNRASNGITLCKYCHRFIHEDSDWRDWIEYFSKKVRQNNNEV